MQMEELQKKLGYTFKDVAMLELALTHPSLAHESGKSIEHNQRLEFLGDAVLQMVLTRELFNRHPSYGEGPLTKARSRLVNSSSLTAKGKFLGLGEYLFLSRGELSSGGRERPSILADAFEAVLGAIYIDGGMEAAQCFVLGIFSETLEEIACSTSLDNPKGELQELLQSASDEAPNYRLVSSTGPDHDRIFECVVEHGGRELGRGSGKSKKVAEGYAAAAALVLMVKEKAAKVGGQTAS
jgi:ribonuclease-3